MNDHAQPPAPGATQTTRAHDIAVALRNTVQLGGSLVVTWSVALIVKLQVPAHLGPVRQGHFGFSESFAMLFFTAIGLGVDMYVIKEVSVRPRHASDFVGGVFALRTLVSLFLFAAMAITLRVTGRPGEVQYAVVVFGLTQLVMSLNATLAAVLQATTRVGRLALANVAAKIVWGAGLLAGLHYQVPLYALALPMLVSELLRTAVLVPAARRAAALRYRIDLSALRKVLVASMPFFVSGVAVVFVSNLAMTVIEFAVRDEREVGWFAAIQNLASLAMLLTPVIAWVIVPLLSRAKARSPEEMMVILRRCIEALIVLIAPITVAISIGSDFLVRVAFGQKYAPAATGLAVLSLVFILTYLTIVLSNALIIMGQSWTTTLISITGVLFLAAMELVAIPIGRAVVGVGGECAGAAAAVIANEAMVVALLLWRLGMAPVDRQNVATLLKCAVVAAIVIVTNHFLRGFGDWRLVLGMALYVILALATRVVRTEDLRRVLAIVRERRAERAAAAASAETAPEGS